MPPFLASTDHVEEIRALNRLFLDSLQTRARVGEECLGLGRAAVVLLSAAPPACLEMLAAFPRALFQLCLSSARSLRVMDPDVRSGGHPSRQALQLTILHSAWSMSRHSPYAARLFLGLEEQDLRALRATTLSDLPRLSASGQLVTCAFPDSVRLWQKLLTETRPESRRQLLLIGLQPRLQTPIPLPHALGQQTSA
ncbi:MAG TPA: hypothetical protein VIM81_13550 [Gammaproteobacteria bacterium]